MRTLLAAVVLLSSTPAAAQVDSDWSLVDGCPDASQARARADAALAQAPPARLTVVIAPGYTARMSLEGAVEAERTLADSDCAALVEATVVLAALSLGLPAPAPEPPPAPEAPPAPQPTPGPDVDPPARRAEPPRGPRPAAPGPELGLRLGLHGVFDGTLADPPLGVGVSFAMTHGALRVAAGLEALPAMRHDRDANAGARFVAVRGALDAGVVGEVLAGDAGRLELGAWARTELGALHGRGFGVAEPEEGAGVLWTLGAGASASFVPRGAPVGLDLSAGVVLPVMRPTFVLDGEPLFTPDPAGLRVSLGLFVELG